MLVQEPFNRAPAWIPAFVGSPGVVIGSEKSIGTFLLVPVWANRKSEHEADQRNSRVLQVLENLDHAEPLNRPFQFPKPQIPFVAKEDDFLSQSEGTPIPSTF